MAFGEFANRPHPSGHFIVIPYDGDPAVQLFLPHDKSAVAVVWKGWLTPGEAVDWVKTAFALIDNARCISEIWSAKDTQPETFESTQTTRLEESLKKVTDDAIVTLRLQPKLGAGDRLYVWGDLRQQPSPAGEKADLPNGGVSEVGIRVLPGDLRESTGKALVGNLLKRSTNINLRAGEVEDLLSQLESKIARLP
jgi:hypothetical protein